MHDTSRWTVLRITRQNWTVSERLAKDGTTTTRMRHDETDETKRDEIHKKYLEDGHTLQTINSPCHHVVEPNAVSPR